MGVKYSLVAIGRNNPALYGRLAHHGLTDRPFIDADDPTLKNILAGMGKRPPRARLEGYDPATSPDSPRAGGCCGPPANNRA